MVKLSPRQITSARTLNQSVEPQRIVSFASGDVPCSASLVVDVIGSMRYTVGGAREIARAFFATANPNDEFQLLTVSYQPQANLGLHYDYSLVGRNHLVLPVTGEP
jgi:hypothetical protein